jgi:hypothetical protein
MALATRCFQPSLDSDYLYPERFVRDLLDGRYPLSGWSISSSPYLFPDFALCALLRLATGGAPVLPYYVVASYAALALASGWALSRAVPGRWAGWLAGVVLVNLVLAMRGLGDDSRWLWWLGTATFHGGAVWMGLALFAVWTGPAEEPPSGRAAAAAGVLMILGGVSDALFLTQFVLPLLAALAIGWGPGWWRGARARSFLVSLGFTVAASAAWRTTAGLLGWWGVPRVFRFLPTPAAVTAAAAAFSGDLSGPMVRSVGAFMALFVLASAAAAALSAFGKSSGDGGNLRTRQASWFAALCLASTVSMPIVAVYWRNPQNGRYLLPALILPSWWLLSRSGPMIRRAAGRSLLLRRMLLAGIAAGFGAAILLSAGGVRTAAWAWPYPDSVARFDRFVAERGLRSGLADYWRAHYLGTLSRGGVHLDQVRPDGDVQFWDNNAFHHFIPGGDGRLYPPLCDYIVADGLDRNALLSRFGAPESIGSAGGYEVWIYRRDAALSMSAAVDARVRSFLGGRPGTERLAPAGTPFR